MRLQTAKYLGYIVFTFKLGLSILSVVCVATIINFYVTILPITEGVTVLVSSPQWETFRFEFTMHTIIVLVTAPIILMSVKYLPLSLKLGLAILMKFRRSEEKGDNKDET